MGEAAASYNAAEIEQKLAAKASEFRDLKREWVPLDWAMTQSNLGGALMSPGERESGTARLKTRFRLIARRWRKRLASGFRSTGRRASAIRGLR
jgi:hypothetical protein